MTSGAAPLIVDGFRRVRRSTFTGGAIVERAEYNRHSRAPRAETAKDASRHTAPDAPERIDHWRSCTRHDHWTCCRGSRGSASLPVATASANQIGKPSVPSRYIAVPKSSLISPDADTPTRRHASLAGLHPRLLCLTNVYFGQL